MEENNINNYNNDNISHIMSYYEMSRKLSAL